MSTGSVSIRTRNVDDTTFVELRISHPMEPGTRKDKQGVVIPAWFMTNIQVFYKDMSVANLELGPLVSRNPAVSLAMKGTQVGEKLKVTWVDNRGVVGESSVKVVA